MFGKEDRLKKNKSHNLSPGPGTYDESMNETKKSSSKWKFGTGNRIDMKGESARNPGPGTYESVSGLNKTGATIKFRHPQMDKHSKYVPGPGNYETKTGMNQTSYSMGKDHRFKSHKESFSGGSPGPGNYEPQNPNFTSPK